MLAARIQEPSVDFACDVTAADQRFRVLGVIDGFTKQSLVLDTDTCFPSRRVTRVLDRVVVERGMQLVSRCDNGPELTSRHFLVDSSAVSIGSISSQESRLKMLLSKVSTGG
jgi:hypothetical protein